MKCSKCEELIYDYLDNELEDPITEQIQSHFNQCPNCNSKFIEKQQVLSFFKTKLTNLGVSDDFSQKVMSRIEEQEASNFLFYAFVSILGSIAFVLVVVTVFLFPVLQIVMKYTGQFLTLWFGVVSKLPFTNILLIVFSIILLFIGLTMRGVIHMEEGQV